MDKKKRLTDMIQKQIKVIEAAKRAGKPK